MRVSIWPLAVRGSRPAPAVISETKTRRDRFIACYPPFLTIIMSGVRAQARPVNLVRPVISTGRTKLRGRLAGPTRADQPPHSDGATQRAYRGDTTDFPRFEILAERAFYVLRWWRKPKKGLNKNEWLKVKALVFSRIGQWRGYLLLERPGGGGSPLKKSNYRPTELRPHGAVKSCRPHYDTCYQLVQFRSN